MARRLKRNLSIVSLVLAVVALPASARAQTPLGDSQPSVSSQPSRQEPRDSTMKGALAASFRLLMMEHAGRIAFQSKTRRELPGPFFPDYARSVKMPRTWSDGDGWFVNYVGHPIHGAAAGRAWLVHHPDHDRDISFTRTYWMSRALATQWATFYSLQFEFGPLSEASIGNVGLHPNTTGWVDHVVTPAGAFGILIAEDALDRYLVQWVERRVGNRAVRATARIFFNPSRALANVADGRTPWWRPRGPLHLAYRPATR